MGEEKMIRVWITCYALSTGIFEADGRITEDDPKACSLFFENGNFRGSVAKPDWHLTRDEAIAQAARLRTARIASLEKQLARLRAMTFEETRPAGR